MTTGRFIAGIAACVWSPETSEYLLLRRSSQKDYAPGAWECVTGRVEQGEGFEEALHREVREELGVEVEIEVLLGTTHFFRGSAIPENELLGVVYLCTLPERATIRLSAEHSEFRWLSYGQAIDLLIAPDPATQWAVRVIERAQATRRLLPKELVEFQKKAGFELG